MSYFTLYCFSDICIVIFNPVYLFRFFILIVETWHLHTLSYAFYNIPQQWVISRVFWVVILNNLVARAASLIIYNLTPSIIPCHLNKLKLKCWKKEVTTIHPSLKLSWPIISVPPQCSRICDISFIFMALLVEFTQWTLDFSALGGRKVAWWYTLSGESRVTVPWAGQLQCHVCHFLTDHKINWIWQLGDRWEAWWTDTSTL